MKKAIIFDMDGVISDTDRTRFELFKILLKKRGLDLDDKDYKKSVGKRTRKFLAETFPNDLTDDEIEEIYHERKIELHKDPKKYVIAQPFVKECCQILHNDGYVLAIASVAQRKDIEMVLNQIEIIDFFTHIISSDDIIHMKPHPEIYLKAVSRLGFQKEECVAIEDSPTGVASAKAANITCVGVTYTHSRDDLNEADYIIDSLSEVNAKILK